jgi:glycosyltransferase involved in cell wall biosynthesis
LIAAPPGITDVIYGGADPYRFRPAQDVRRSGVLFVGRLTPHKGVDVLIRALPARAHLTVVGSEGHDPVPPERDYPGLLRQLASGRNVRFAGAVPDERLPEIMRAASVVVLPSVERTYYGRQVGVSELLGLVLLEAMMSGTPVLASRLGGIPEIVRHGETGFLVEPGNELELRERLAELLEDPALVARMGRRGREVAEATFTWTACAARCLDAYTDVLSGRKRGLVRGKGAR